MSKTQRTPTRAPAADAPAPADVQAALEQSRAMPGILPVLPTTTRREEPNE